MTKNKNPWGNSFSSVWQYNVPPARPSFAELVLYSKHLQEIQNNLKEKAKILILGSTPEFRDWAFEKNVESTVVDYNKENYRALNRFMHHQDINESFIESNWLQINIKERFDLAVADHAFGVLKREDVSIFLKNVADALKKNGIFITKQYFCFKMSYKNLEELFKSYYEKLPYENILEATMNELISFEAMDTGSFSFKDVFAKLKKLYSDKIIKAEDFKKFSDLGWENINFKLFIPTEVEWKKLINQYFEVLSIERTDDIYAETMPIYFLKKK